MWNLIYMTKSSIKKTEMCILFFAEKTWNSTFNSYSTMCSDIHWFMIIFEGCAHYPSCQESVCYHRRKLPVYRITAGFMNKIYFITCQIWASKWRPSLILWSSPPGPQSQNKSESLAVFFSSSNCIYLLQVSDVSRINAVSEHFLA